MKILVINSGSSSIKYSLFQMNGSVVLAAGIIEQIGESKSIHKITLIDPTNTMQTSVEEQDIVDHKQGLKHIIQLLLKSGILKQPSELSVIGHRVVHGGDKFCVPTLITQEVLNNIKKMIPLAPLHNPANLMGIEVALEFAGDIPQVAVFDTAFHQSIPEYAYRYAIPKQLYLQEGIRRYGFHGTSHAYVSKQAADFLGKPLDTVNLITLHLGNGGSVTAVKQGKSIDTSMGMTPLEGLVMGTRCGDIDPAIPFYLNKNCDMSSEAIDTLLNKASGLKGICGENDMRAIHQMADEGNLDAQLAIDMYCYRIKKYIGSYFAVLGQVDALVFTGGIGENDVQVRERICEGLNFFGVGIDPKKNSRRGTRIMDVKKEDSVLSVLVVKTDEELEIALQSMACVKSQRISH